MGRGPRSGPEPGTGPRFGLRPSTTDVLGAAVDAVRTDPRMVLVTLVGGLLSSIPLVGNVFNALANGIAVDMGYRTFREGHRVRTGLGLRLVYLVAALLVAAIIVGIGLIFLILPGIYLALRFALHPAAVMVDGEGPLRALSESWNRTGGHLLTILGFWLALFVPLLVLLVVLFFAMTGGRPTELAGDLTFQLLVGLVGAPFSALNAAGVAVMYEAFGG